MQNVLNLFENGKFVSMNEFKIFKINEFILNIALQETIHVSNKHKTIDTSRVHKGSMPLLHALVVTGNDGLP